MGNLVGHVLPGLGFFLIGLWHLLNHIKLHALNPSNYTSLPWFPSSKMRYLELFVILAGSSISVAMELFIGPDRHQPLDSDGTIPSYHLQNFEHSSISLTFIAYAAFGILLDKRGGAASHAKHGLTYLLGAIALGQELLLFHVHSADHMGVEGQFHLLLQIVVFVSLLTTLMSIGYPNSFLTAFVRSISIIFQGLWLVVMGFMLWTPALVPKGCFINTERGHQVVRCRSDEALHRARALVNIQFSWYLIFVTIFAMSSYLFLTRIYGPEKVVVADYQSLPKFQLEEEDEDNDDEDVEAGHKKTDRLSASGNSKSFIHMGKPSAPLDIER